MPDRTSADAGSHGQLAELADIYGLEEPARIRLETVLELLGDDPHAPTTVRAPGDAVERHLADSLVALRLAPVGAARRAADIGSGAGFPGFPLAIALPKASFSLVESVRRKCIFLQRVRVALEAANVEIVCRRVEEWAEGAESHDLVLARALGPQPVVLEYAAPLLEVGGVLVDWRGVVSGAEAAAAGRAAEQLGLAPAEVHQVVPFSGASRLALYVWKKVRTTPELFPRRVGRARRKPLGTELSP